MSRSQREERGERRSSAREWAEKQSLGYQAQYLSLPKGVKLFKPKAGLMLLDIIPFIAGKGNPWAEEGVEWWERTYWVHRGIGANNESYLCPRKSSKGRCPICEHRIALVRKSGEDDDAEESIKALAPKQRQLFNIINRKEPDKGIQLFDISYHLFGETLTKRLISADEDDNWDNFWMLDDGLTLKVAFSDDSYAGRSFVRADTIDFKPRPEQYDAEEMLKEASCLDDCLVELEYPELKKIYFEMAGEEDDEDKPKKKHHAESEDEDEPPRRKGRHVVEEEEESAPKKRRPVEDEDEDKPPKKKPADDDDWDDFDDKPSKKKPAAEEEPAPKKRRPVEDEDDEPAPKKRRQEEPEEDEPKKKKPAADDDWDDFDDDKPSKKKSVEEEDEPPRKKRRAEQEELDLEPPRKKRHAEPEEEDEPAPRKKRRQEEED